jgi:hypothetical protein
MSNSFRMFKRPGPPGEYYGYATIDGVTYKINARSAGKRKEWRMIGTIKRHLKADQQRLPLGEMIANAINKRVDTEATALADPDLNDEMPF